MFKRTVSHTCLSKERSRHSHCQLVNAGGFLQDIQNFLQWKTFAVHLLIEGKCGQLHCIIMGDWYAICFMFR